MKELSYIAVSTKNMKPQTKLLLDTLFELRGKDWNRAPVEDTSDKSPPPAGKGTDVYELPES
jgi:hypothetical protein